MKRTATKAVSVRLRHDIQQRLERLAQASGRRTSVVVADAVEKFLDEQEDLAADLDAIEAGMKAGHYIPDDAMRAWLLSWGTGHELPPPQCACGRDHGSAN